MFVGAVTFEDHEFFVIEHEIWAFVEGGEHGECFGEFEGVASCLGVTFCGRFAEFDEAEDLFRESVTNSGDGTSGPAVDKAVVDLSVDSSHEDDGFINAGDVFSGVAERVCSAEFFEADEGGEFFTQREEEVRFGLKPVVRRVVNDGGEISASGEDFGKVVDLSGRRFASREDARDDHEAVCADFACVSSMSGSDGGVLCSGADNGGDACRDEAANAFHALVVCEERPIAHGAAVDDTTHALIDEALASFDKGVIVDFSL